MSRSKDLDRIRLEILTIRGFREAIEKHGPIPGFVRSLATAEAAFEDLREELISQGRWPLELMKPRKS